jgi:hypothetical protein
MNDIAVNLKGLSVVLLKDVDIVKGPHWSE